MIIILRLGHRNSRDARISTHCGLVARAFGADKIIYTGEKDSSLLKTLESISKRFGGSFKSEYQKNWKKTIEEYKKKKYTIVHLTIYGLEIQRLIKKIRTKTNLLIIVGGKKVPSEVYRLADYNISVTNQPHSEISALSIFLHEYFKGKELEKSFSKPKIKIIPQEYGKKVIIN